MFEAEGAMFYWSAVRQILPDELNFVGRETRGASDPFNAMLNLGYQTVLLPEVWKAVSYTLGWTLMLVTFTQTGRENLLWWLT